MPTEKTTEPSTTGIVISFIVPAYNEEAELPGTLRAIRSAATGYEHEIVLVNDGSTDATVPIGEEFGALLISIERRQIAAARNAGAAAARGNIFIFVDADTRIGPEHVRGAVEALESGCAGGGARLATDREIPLWGRIFFRVFTTLYFGLNLGAGAFLFTTRENFLAVGGFDEIYFASEEIFFTIALRSEHQTSELQSLRHLVCRLLLQKKKNKDRTRRRIILLRTSSVSQCLRTRPRFPSFL